MPRRLHARHAVQLGNESLLHSANLGAVLIPPGSHVERERVRGVKAEIDMRQIPEAAQQQAGARQEGHREGDLAGDERGLKDAAASDRAAPGAQQRGGALPSGGAQRGEQSECEGAQAADYGGKGERAPIHVQLGDARRLREHFGEQAHGDGCACISGRRAGHGEPHNFAQERGDDLGAASADGEADRDLALASVELREEQRRYIRHGDEEQQRHGAEEQDQRLAGITEARVLQITERDRPVFVGGRILLAERALYAGKVGLRFRNGDARLHPRDAGKEARVALTQQEVGRLRRNPDVDRGSSRTTSASRRQC